MSEKWWYVHDGTVLGPTLEMHLAAMLRDRTLGPGHWVWNPSLTGWTRLREVTTFQRHLRPTDRPGDPPEPVLPLPDPDGPMPARPLPRLLAQGVDIMIGITLLTPIVVLLAIALGFNRFESNIGQFIAAWVLILLALLLQAAMVALTGTTPGKALLGLRLTRLDGGRPDFPTLLKRQLRLWVEGLGLGLHPSAPFTAAFSHRRIMRGQPTRWDATLGLRVWQHDDRRMRHPLAFLAYSALLSLAPNLPNPFHALMPDEEGRLYTQPTALSDHWRNPVTGKVGRLATGWTIEMKQLADGGTAHLF